MPSAPQISDAEWEVMKAIWDAAGALTAGEVVQRLEAQGTRWRPRTIKTLLARLVQKKAVHAETEVVGGRTFVYRAALSRESCLRRESRSFLSRVFDGNLAPALVQFLKVSELSRDDIEHLKQLLDAETAVVNRRQKGRAS